MTTLKQKMKAYEESQCTYINAETAIKFFIRWLEQKRPKDPESAEEYYYQAKIDSLLEELEQ